MDQSGGYEKSTTSIQVTALDGLVNVNSLFTIGVFVGLSLTSPGQRSLEGNSACDAGPDMVRNLLAFEVVSFSFFLSSSLIAQGLKLAINLLNSKDVDEAFRVHINARVLRLGMAASSSCCRWSVLYRSGLGCCLAVATRLCVPSPCTPPVYRLLLLSMRSPSSMPSLAKSINSL